MLLLNIVDNKIYYSWEQFEEDIVRLLRIYKPLRHMIKNIYGIPRGGLLAAAKLSNILNIPLILNKNRISTRTLVIDDISDTGKTLKNLLKNKKFFSVATLWISDKTEYDQVSYCRIKEFKDWVVFPWE